MLAKVLHLLHWQVVACQVQPRVHEHGTVARGEDETVAVEPLGISWVVREPAVGTEQDSADLGTAEGQTQVAGLARSNGVHRQTTGFIRHLCCCYRDTYPRWGYVEVAFTDNKGGGQDEVEI